MEAKVIAILRGVEPEKLPDLVEALLAGGIRAVEVTLNSTSPLEQIRTVVRVAGGRALVGAGTVLDESAAAAAIMAGAEFLLAPNVNEGVIRTAHRYGKPVLPGAMTPTEIAVAVEAGADIVKVFPAATLGPRYFKEVKNPLDHVVLMATGGISAENAREFLQAGADLIGVGGKLVDRQLLAADRLDEITRRAAELVRTVRPG
ncbi:MAG: bifunctional 4-hydroxy-2-oxoglutarate aldolase/2-dehydro-3-deoxy-phosphogluconate aldolase [Limnochordaceae bacterium]|nr:bifunctional 4-hydroxy-2-oxoglutarate aldolase/2-dehydro-3-deoxy-phosphogluconate aldolase [Limnochordaceae bacterium]